MIDRDWGHSRACAVAADEKVLNNELRGMYSLGMYEDHHQTRKYENQRIKIASQSTHFDPRSIQNACCAHQKSSDLRLSPKAFRDFHFSTHSAHC